jgi:hypothetical protein
MDGWLLCGERMEVCRCNHLFEDPCFSSAAATYRFCSCPLCTLHSKFCLSHNRFLFYTFISSNNIEIILDNKSFSIRTTHVNDTIFTNIHRRLTIMMLHQSHSTGSCSYHYHYSFGNYSFQETYPLSPDYVSLMGSFPVSSVERAPCPVPLGVVRRSFPRVCPSLVTGEFDNLLFIHLREERERDRMILLGRW